LDCWSTHSGASLGRAGMGGDVVLVTFGEKKKKKKNVKDSKRTNVLAQKTEGPGPVAPRKRVYPMRHC